MAESYSVEAVLKAVGSDEFINAFKKAKEQVEGFDQQTQRSAKSTDFTMGKLVGAIGITTALSKGYNMVKESVGRAFGRIDTMEQFERVMTTLTGSTDKANEVLDKVNDTVKGTAYGLDVGAKAVQGFVTSNMDVDKATMTFEAWGDAVAFYGDGTNATLGSVTDALAKATAKGKIQMDTMNSLAEAGIPAMQIYADATGQSVEEVAAQMQKGNIKAEEFHEIMNDAMINGTKNFEAIKGAAKEAGASWTGSFDNMRAAVTRGVIAIIQNIDDMLADNNLPSMRDMVAEFGKKFEETLKKAADAIPPIFTNIKKVYDVLKPWLPLVSALALGVTSMIVAWSAFNTVKNIINSVKAAYVALNLVMSANPWILIVGAVIAAATLVYVYWEPISEFFVKLWDKIKVIWGNTVDWFKDIWGSISDWFKNLWNGLVAFLKEWGLVILGLLTGPIGLAVALIYKYWEPIKEFFSNVWESVKEKTSEIWNSIVEMASSVWNTITETIMNILQPFIDTFMNLWNSVKDGVMQVFEGLKMYFTAAWDLIKNIFLGAILLILNLVTGNFEELKSNTKAIWDNIKQSFSQIWESIKLIFTGALNIVKGYVKAAWENIKVVTSTTFNAIRSLITTIWSGIRTVFNTVINFIVNFVKTSWNNIKSTTSSVFNGVKSSITSIWNGIKSFFTQTLSNIINTVRQQFSNMVSAIQSKMSEVKGKITSGWNSALSFLKGINLMSIGKDVIQGFINGIKSKIKGVADAAKSAADAVTGKIKSILKIASPSKVMTQMGKWTGEGMAKGIKASTKSVSKAAQEQAKAAKLATSESIENLKVKYNTKKMNPTSYINNLKKIQQQHKLTGDQSRKVQKEIYRANEALKKQAAGLKTSLNKINDGVKGANNKYFDKIKSINTKLKNDIKKVNDDFKKKLSDLTKTIYNQVGLFDKGTEKKDVKGSDLLKNLKGQNTQFKQWQKDLSAIQSKGVSKKFVDELRGMGVSASNEISAIASMPKSMLNEYTKAWKVKNDLAKNEANAQLKTEKSTVSKQITALNKAATSELNKAKKEWSANLNKLSGDVANLGSFKNSGKVLGKNTVDGLIKGLKSMKGPLEEQAMAMAKTIDKTIRKTLKIKSPSRVTAEDGKFVGEGLILGMLAKVREISSAAKEMAIAAVPDIGNINIADRVDMLNGVANTQLDVSHSNATDNQVVNLLQKIANSNQVIVLDTGELVGGTYREYDRVGGNRMELAERWGE